MNGAEKIEGRRVLEELNCMDHFSLLLEHSPLLVDSDTALSQQCKLCRVMKWKLLFVFFTLDMLRFATAFSTSLITKSFAVNRNINKNVNSIIQSQRRQRITRKLVHLDSSSRIQQYRLYMSSSDDTIVSSDSSLTPNERKMRQEALHKYLSSVGIDVQDLSSAVQEAMTTSVNNPYYGKSAIKAYRTFIYPRPSKIQSAREEDVQVAASRCARQIDFLAKRHRSHEAEWVRHHDTQDDADEKSRKLFPLLILLDNVRSAFNVGSIFRSADACGCSLVITTGITPNPHGSGREKLAKSALQADRVVSSMHFATTKEAVEFLRKDYPDYALVGMETTDLSKCYTSEEYPGKGYYTVNGELPQFGTVLVLGNEVTGVDTEVMPLLDKIVEIPMFGKKNSLNISAAAPVVMYEVLRQWGAMEEEE